MIVPKLGQFARNGLEHIALEDTIAFEDTNLTVTALLKFTPPVGLEKKVGNSRLTARERTALLKAGFTIAVDNGSSVR